MSDELSWQPAWRIRKRIEWPELSCLEVVDHSLARIERHNHTLHAFAEVDSGAIASWHDREELVLRATQAFQRAFSLVEQPGVC